jgi:hypothetical protein
MASTHLTGLTTQNLNYQMTKKTRKAIIILGLLLVGLIGFIKLGTMLSPGSYGNAEIYEFNYSENQVQEAVRKFKIQHPDMVVPTVTIGNRGSFDLSKNEGRKDSSWRYFLYFYYPKENQIIFSWTRPVENGKTRFAFVSVNNGLEIGHWQDINHDFRSAQNKQLKQEFEERILSPIREILKKEK